MIKVLQKTFAILEYIAVSPHPVTPGELVEVLNLPQPTAARILRDLAELGYLEQSGARKGYRPGPVFYLIAGGKLYDDEFMRFARTEIRECARELGQSVLFAVRRRNSRLILCHYNYNPRFRIDTRAMRFHDLYVTASGRMLLAFAPEGELDTFIRENGLPAPEVWPGAADGIDILKRELGRIRTDRCLELQRSFCGNFHIYARPVFRGRAFLGAVAANWDVDAPANLSAQYRRGVTTLAQTLTNSGTAAVG